MNHPLLIGEIAQLILNYTSCGSDYKAFRIVCKCWYLATGDRIDEFSNHLLTLIEKFPYKDWQWYYIARNPNITPKIINNYKSLFYLQNKYGSWLGFKFYLLLPTEEYLAKKNLLYNLNSEWDFLRSSVMDDIIKLFPYVKVNSANRGINYFTELNIDSYRRICLYLITIKYINVHDIIKFLIPLCWRHGINYNQELTKQSSLTFEIVKQYPLIRWDKSILSYHSNITCQDIEANLDFGWNWSNVSINPNLTWDFVLKHIDKGWRWDELSRHNNITFDIIIKYKQYPWDYITISYNPNITPEIIEQNPQIGWYYMGLSFNKNISLNFVITHINKKWDWIVLSNRYDISITDIIINHNLPWNWCVISCRDDVSPNMINNHPNLPWNFGVLSKNKNITWQFVIQHIDKDWNWRYLSQNVFNKTINE